LKSFALFAAFMNIPDIKACIGKCHSYIMDTYIAKMWMQKKEKLLLYKRLTTHNFDQSTSCPTEHENLFMKWGDIVVNPQQNMHQTVHTINKNSNSRFTVNVGHSAKNFDATQNWSITNTNEFVSTYAEG
jgi:hypothetical protein